MMKRVGVSVVAVLAAMLWAAESRAEWYVSVSGAMILPSDLKAAENDYRRPVGRFELTDIAVDMKTGFMVGAALGRSTGPLRLEGELFYGRFEFESSAMANGRKAGLSEDVGLRGGMLSGWYDVSWESGLTPYVGGGLGLYRTRSSSSDGPDVVNDGPVWRVGAGIVFDVGERVAIDAGWRFMRGFSRIEDRVEGIRYDRPLELHAFLLSLRYSL